MDYLLKPFLTVLFLTLAVITYRHLPHSYYRFTPFELPQWWGPGDESKVDTSQYPFVINISTDVLRDLQFRLENTKTFQPPLEGAGFTYGFNTDYLQEILEYWKNEYNWKAREEFFNSYPQFTTVVAGLKIHYIHLKPNLVNVSADVKVRPILVMHGWAEAIRNLFEFISHLSQPRPGEKLMFEVIAPALPGFGFSDAPTRPGMGSIQIAVLMNSFMKQLGFPAYYVQGGDFGGYIGTYMAQLYPKRVAGLHITMCHTPFSVSNTIKLLIGKVFPSLIVEENEADKVYPLSEYFKFLIEESGYFHEQCTKPDTIGVALNESPIGLAAYILEKYSTLTNPAFKQLPDGGFRKSYKMEDLIDIVMIYWLSGTVTSSMRLYSESFSTAQRLTKMTGLAVKVPFGCARFPHEISFTPKSFLKQKFLDVVQITDYESGGHFASFENPKLLADDVWSTVKKIHARGRGLFDKPAEFKFFRME